MDYKKIYKLAYDYMDNSIIDGDCGELCNYHCCRDFDSDGEKLGIYLMPYEYESMLRNSRFLEGVKVEKHSSKDYFISKKIKFLHYIFCGVESKCLREYRPIQCRTYPFEPHLEDDTLSLVVEKDQVHDCPLLSDTSKWREEFVRGIYMGWKELITIPKVYEFVVYESRRRVLERNISLILSDFSNDFIKRL
ncbi:hypothetical protein CLPU_4c00110 [Gottschalkia purinilytica]|uniref:Uncharacterized protein n=1 Tax=Gottschalkia purinilytica TaxID=1503 RepID=A0A0L0WC30_GOTPU|nr:hypothetical protein [Gottschalkia purinilytica]KNF08965.1 hypothetical protein CLPU_4c00110 [Gottschalkia purinilytica]